MDYLIGATQQQKLWALISGCFSPQLVWGAQCTNNFYHFQLTDWVQDKMASITTFSKAFSWMEMYKFRTRFHWNLFPRVQLIIFQHWFIYWLGAIQAPSHYLNQWCLVYWCIYTVGTPYNTNVGVQKIPDRAIWKPVVAKRNNTNPWSCSEPQILVRRDSRQVHMAEQPASRDRLE